MVVTALGLLLGGRADSGAGPHRRPDRPGRGDGAPSSGLPAVRGRGRRGRGRGRGRPGRPRPHGQRRGPLPGLRRRRLGAGQPAGRPRRVRSSRCTASPTSTGCCSRAAQRDALDAVRRRRRRRAAGPLPHALRRSCAPPSASSTTSPPTPGTAPARPTCCGSASSEVEAGRAAAGRGRRAGGRGVAARPRRLAAARGRERARRAVGRRATSPTPSAPSPPPGPRWRACASTTREAAELADRVAELCYVLADLAADVASYASGLETDPDRLAARLRAAGGADRAHPQVRRDHRRGARLAASARRPASLDLDGTDERIEQLRAERDRLQADLTDVAASSRRPAREAAGRLARRRSPASWPTSRCRTRGSRSWSTQRDQFGCVRSRRGRLPAGRQRRRASPRRSTRVPRAASCRG